MVYKAQSGHIGGSLSCAEILTVLYFSEMRVDPANSHWEDRDRFVASKGHCAPMLYAVLAKRGFFPEEELLTLRTLGSRLQGHPNMSTIKGVDISTGSLGMGLSVGLGMAISARLLGKGFYTYVLMGDGELQEGQVWESAMSASKFCVDNCIAIVDHNKVQLDGKVDDIMPLGDLALKWRSFGWNVIEADGHDVQDMLKAINHAKSVKKTPSVIIADTVKGKGVSFMENNHKWHGAVIGKDDYESAMRELGGEADD
ncbi:MAG: transketolase [Oscillospiraceae bacterium]|nr:transketolase [Oscillospiraceae bacterium]